MPRRILPIALALALGLIAWLLLRDLGGAPTLRPAVPSAEGVRDVPAAATPTEAEGATATERSREIVPQPELPTVEPTLAVIAVRVVAREDRSPLAGVSVHVAAGAGGGTRSVRSDENGRAEVAVPAHSALSIQVRPEPGRHGADQRALSAGGPGERAEVELALSTQPDQLFFGRLVDAQSGAGVSPAVLHRELLNVSRGSDHAGHERGPGVAPVDADGRFLLEIGTWDSVLLCIHAPGWSLATLQLTGGHDAPERELLVPLVRAARLAVDVLDAEGHAAEGVLVRLTADGFSLQQRDSSAPLFGSVDPSFEAVTGRDGRIELQGLPARAALSLTATRGPDEQRTLELAALEPGEERSLELRLGGGARVDGEALLADGAPLPDVEIWLVAGAREGFLDSRSDQAVARARTNTEGRFTFEDVHPGAWSAGIAPQGRSVPAEQRLSPVCAPFEVAASTSSVDVRLVAHRGLTIEGTVLDPTGTGVARVSVWGMARTPRGRFEALSDEQGGFVLAGLAPGEFELQAMPGLSFALFPPVRASAGARGVVLRLVAAASLAGRVEAPPGRQLALANLFVSRSDGDFPLQDLSMRALSGSSFEVGGLPAGVWGVSVATPEGLVGVLGGIALSAGERREGLVLRLEPGAELRVRDALGEALAGCAISVHVAGACVGWNGVQAGQTAVFRVPPGRARVIATRGSEVIRALDVDVLPGAVSQAVLE